VFDPLRWAEAFTELCGRDIDEGVETLNVFMACVEKLAAGTLAGTEDARKLEVLLRAALVQAGFGPDNRGAELAVRFLALLVKRDLFKYRLVLLQGVHQAADRVRGISRVTLELVEPVTAEIERDLKKELLKKTGAKEMVLSTRINPELIAGFRLYIGTEVFDTSLRERLRIMRWNLSNAGTAAAGGGTR
jgi:F-type H+-transporting ATPase subunit delta